MIVCREKENRRYAKTQRSFRLFHFVLLISPFRTESAALVAR